MQPKPSSELLVRLEIGDNRCVTDVNFRTSLIPVSRLGHRNRSFDSAAPAHGRAFTVPQSLLQQYFLRLDRDEEVRKPAGSDPTLSGMLLPAFQDLAAGNHDLPCGSPLESP